MGRRGKRALLALVAVLAMAAAAYSGAGGFTGAASTSGTRAASGSGPGSEGIKVHGHWKLTVVNPDGSMAHATEFENSLAPNLGEGAGLLVRLLSGNGSAGGWQITLEQDGQGAVTVYPVTLDFPTANHDVLLLRGQATVANATTVTGVSTWLYRCSSDLSPDDCLADHAGPPFAGAYHKFTTKTSTDTDALPVDVQAGQVVQVSVRLSFS